MKSQLFLQLPVLRMVSRDIDKKLAADFEAETGIKVEFQTFPVEQFDNVIKTKLATDEGPDMWRTLAGSGLQSFNVEENCLDLSNESWVANMEEAPKPGASFNGKLYGLNIWSVDTTAILYNTQMFEEYQLEVPTNYEEFLNVCETLKSNGIRPIFEFKDTWHQHYWPEVGMLGAKADRIPDLYNKLNSNEIKYADVPEFVTVPGRLKEIVDKGYFGETYLSDTFDMSFEAMGTGKAAMIIIWSSYQKDVFAQFPESKANEWKMFANPLYDEPTMLVTPGGNVTLGYKKSEHPEAILAYFDFLTRLENLQAFYDERHDLSIPSFKGVVSEPSNGWNSMVETIAPDRRITSLDLVKYHEGWNYGGYIQEMYLSNLTPAETAAKYDLERGKTAKAAGDPNW